MAAYIFIFIVTFINCFVNKRISNNVTVFLLLMLSALRYDVGYDYETYLDIMQSDDTFMLERMELLERFFMRMSIALHFYQLFFIINSCIVFFCIYKFINTFSLNHAFSYFVFLCCPLMLTQSYSIVRHWTAVAIVLYGTTFLYERKTFKFLLCIICASFCHGVGCVGLLFIPLFRWRINLRMNLVLLAGSFLLGHLVNIFLANLIGVDSVEVARLANYAQKVDGEQGLTKLPYLFLIVDILFLCTYGRLRRNTEKWRWICVFNLGVCFLFLFSFQTTLSIRFSTLFLPAIMICFPYYLGRKVSGNNITNLLIFVIVLGACFFLNLSIYNPLIGRSQYLPYEFFFG